MIDGKSEGGKERVEEVQGPSPGHGRGAGWRAGERRERCEWTARVCNLKCRGGAQGE